MKEQNNNDIKENENNNVSQTSINQNDNVQEQAIDSDEKPQEAKSELEELKEQLEKQKDAYLRLLAEFDNFRKRTEKEKYEIGDIVKCSVIKDFLPILDNLEKALEVAKEHEAIYKGIELVVKSFKQTLEKYEIKEINTECDFDPNMHEALLMVESDTPNKIVQTFEKGYTYKDKLLRPAKVSVGKSNQNNNEEV